MDMHDLVRRWAYLDPITAYWLAQTPLPRDYQMQATFTTAAAAKSLRTQLPNQLSCDYFIYEIAYTVWLPRSSFQGNILGPGARVSTAQLPGILLGLEITGCTDLAITDGLEPIELAATSPFNQTRVSREFPIYYGAGLGVELALQEGFPDEQLPLTVYLVTRGVIMPCRASGGLDADHACYLLKTVHGVDVPRSTSALEGIGSMLSGMPPMRRDIPKDGPPNPEGGIAR